VTTEAQTETKNPLNQLQELEAMKVIASELAKLDEPAVKRVLQWAADAFKTKVTVTASFVSATASSESSIAAPDIRSRFPSLPEFFAAASPSQDNDKALIVGYWTQFVLGEAEFDAQSINKELKNLGHGVGNITSAFDSLMARKPQLVLQTRKSGTSKQARKLYKLTLEGQRSVERMVGGATE
jgi:hypothetical protein